MSPSNSRQRQVFRFVPTSLLVIAIVLALSLISRFSFAQSRDPAASHPSSFSHSLPQLDGAHLRATVVEVNYAPGEADKPHSHPCTVI
jgi:hypothetical protein